MSTSKSGPPASPPPASQPPLSLLARRALEQQRLHNLTPVEIRLSVLVSLWLLAAFDPRYSLNVSAAVGALPPVARRTFYRRLDRLVAALVADLRS